MNNRDKIIDKIKKCLRLAESSDPNEAAAALAKAHELMAAYRIGRHEVKVEKRVGKYTLAKKPKDYEAYLLDTIAAMFRCEKWIKQGEGVRGYNAVFLGEDVNAEIASYAYDGVCWQLGRERRQFMRQLSKRMMTKNKAKRADAYCLGWCIAVCTNLAHLVPSAPLPDSIAKYMESMLPNMVTRQTRKTHATRRYDDDLSVGYASGAQFELNKAVKNNQTTKSIT